MPLNNPISEPQIPQEVARDTEVTGAMNAHLAASDPHSQYLRESEGDARYRKLSVTLLDVDIPSTIARDAEVTAAINAHVNLADPHTQYATQARADERYGLVKKYIFYGTTSNTQGGSAAIPHGGLIVSKILAMNAVIEHAPGTIVAPSHLMTAGYEFDLSANSSAVYVGNIAAKSFNILSKPVRIVIDYII